PPPRRTNPGTGPEDLPVRLPDRRIPTARQTPATPATCPSYLCSQALLVARLAPDGSIVAVMGCCSRPSEELRCCSDGAYEPGENPDRRRAEPGDSYAGRRHGRRAADRSSHHREKPGRGRRHGDRTGPSTTPTRCRGCRTAPRRWPPGDRPLAGHLRSWHGATRSRPDP